MPKLTVIIPCKNEAANIGQCIASVRELADELIVADSGSSDATMEIAAAMGANRIIEREYENYASFNNWAAPQAANDWVLVVDADERITPELAKEIRELLGTDPPHDGYKIRRDSFFFGYQITGCGWSNDWIVRLFRKSVSHHRRRRVHPGVEVTTGNIGELAGRMLHFNVRDLDQWIARANKYSTWSARDRFEAGRRTSKFNLFLRGPARFFSSYILRGGIWDGVPGFIVAMSAGFMSFLKAAKVWCMANAVEFPELPQWNEAAERAKAKVATDSEPRTAA